MENLEKLLQLPYQTLAILVGGYLAYRLAYTGRDSTHRTIDTAAIALVFAFIAQMASAWALTTYVTCYPLPETGEVPLWVGYCISLTGIVATILVAAFWRRLGVVWVATTLRVLGISSADRNVTAWESVIGNEHAGPSSITVLKTNGQGLMCERLIDFKDDQHGPLILGQDGSVALFVTHTRDAGSEDWEPVSPRYEDWGPELTIVPANQVLQIRMRHKDKQLPFWRRWCRWLAGRRADAGPRDDDGTTGS